MLKDKNSSTTPSQDAMKSIQLTAQGQNFDQQFQRELAKQLEKQDQIKNKKKIQTHHAQTRQPIRIQNKLYFPLGLIGRLFKKAKKQDNFQPQVQLGTCFLISKNCAISSAHQIDNLDDEYQILIKIPNNHKLGDVKVNIKKSCVSQSYKNDPIIQNDYHFLRISLSAQQDLIMENLFKDNQVLFSQPLEENAKDITFKAQIFGFIKKIPEELQPIFQQEKKQIYEKNLNTSQSQMHYDGKCIEYSAFTLDGMSGSPIFIRNFNNKLIVVGIHICGNSYQQKNYGLLFTSKFYTDLKNFLGNPNHLKQESIKDLVQIQYSFQEIIKQIRPKKLQQRLETIGNYLKGILDSVQYLEGKSIFIDSLTDENISVNSRGELKLRNLSLSTTCFGDRQLQEIDPQYLNLNYLKKFFASNLYIKNLVHQLSLMKNIKIDPANSHHLPSFIMYIISKKKYTFTFQLNNFITKKQKEKTQLQELEVKKDLQAQQVVKNISEDNPLKKFQDYFTMKTYTVDSFKNRAQKFCLLMRYSSKKLTKISFLRIYMVTIMTLYANIKTRINILKQLQYQNLAQFLDKLDKIDQQIACLFRCDRERYCQKKLKFYLQQFQKKEIAQDKKIIFDLMNYQAIFFGNILNIIMEIVQKFNKLAFESLFSKYNQLKLKPALEQIKIDFNLHQMYDNLPQNVNRLKVARQSKRVFYKDIRLLCSIFEQKQTSDYIYKVTSMKRHEREKYKVLLQSLVQIKNDNDKTVGTGFIIADDLVCTALHVFGSINHIDQLNIAIQRYEVYISQELKYTMVQAYPKIISNQMHRKPQFDDIVIVRVDKKFQRQKFYITNHPRNFDYSNFKQQRQFAMILGYGKSQKDKDRIVYKKSIGQITLSSCLPNSYHINLKADHVVSGSPVLVQSTPQDYLVLGVYAGTIKQQCQYAQSYGKYSKFTEENFNDLKNQQNFKPISITQYDKFQNDEIFKLYVYQHYGGIDHFLLRIIAEILKLNYYHFYLKQLKRQNLILNRDDNLNILFTNLKMVNKTDIKLPQEVRQHRDTMSFIIAQSEKINLKSFYRFIHYIYSLFKKDKNQSIFLAQMLDNNVNQDTFALNNSTLNQFIQKLDRRYFIKTAGKDKNLLLYQQQIIQSKRKSEQSTYYDLYQRYFVCKPKYRLQRLLVSQNLLKNPTHKNQPAHLMHNEYRKINTQRSLFSRFNLLRKNDLLNQLHNEDESLGHFTLLSKIFELRRQQVEEQMKKKIVPTQEQKNKYTQYLQKITRGLCLTKKTKDAFIQQEIQQFKKHYQLIHKWRKIEEVLQQIYCLQQIKNDNLIKKDIEDDQDSLEFD